MESHKLAVRVQQLEAFLQFICIAETEIRFSAIPVEQIVQRHGTELKFLQTCADDCESGVDFFTAWQNSIKFCAKNEGFSESDLGLLKRFGMGFGASDTEGQISHCKLYYQLILNSLKGAREDKTKKAKLYQMFGVFSGMAAAFLLC